MSIHKAHTAHNIWRDDASDPFKTTVLLAVHWDDHQDYDGVGAALAAMDDLELLNGAVLGIVRKADGLHVTLTTSRLDWAKAGQFENEVITLFSQIRARIARTVPWQGDDY